MKQNVLKQLLSREFLFEFHSLKCDRQQLLPLLVEVELYSTRSSHGQQLLSRMIFILAIILIISNVNKMCFSVNKPGDGREETAVKEKRAVPLFGNVLYLSLCIPF